MLRNCVRWFCSATATPLAGSWDPVTGPSKSSAGGTRSALDCDNDIASAAKLPTRAVYEALPTEELMKRLRTKDEQIIQLRKIYENFHYEVEKRFRVTVLDYHDKALALGKVHQEMHASSMGNTRETIKSVRDRDDKRNRDRRIVTILCFVTTLAYWYWLRKHYVNTKEETNALIARSVSGPGMRGNENVFSSVKSNARHWETPYEREVRLRNEGAAESGVKPQTDKLARQE